MSPSSPLPRDYLRRLRNPAIANPRHSNAKGPVAGTLIGGSGSRATVVRMPNVKPCQNSGFGAPGGLGEGSNELYGSMAIVALQHVSREFLQSARAPAEDPWRLTHDVKRRVEFIDYRHVSLTRTED
jgi:hypothetical protein